MLLLLLGEELDLPLFPEDCLRKFEMLLNFDVEVVPLTFAFDESFEPKQKSFRIVLLIFSASLDCLGVYVLERFCWDNPESSR